jgi:hypothetical protein
MSSSAGAKTDQKKGIPKESKALLAIKEEARVNLEARTAALTARYAGGNTDLFEVGRTQVLQAHGEGLPFPGPIAEHTEATIDLSAHAGFWRGERRPFGIVLTRGPGELLVVSESTSRPGEWTVKYDPPFPEEGTALNPE